ncbi:hypothetical protein B0H14DRAFT_2599746 [Mycena olivaceomarginata]|nr:hypothetical protein B0H14DRAFT_2599746 [Mycena olivaceomarginata]
MTVGAVSARCKLDCSLKELRGNAGIQSQLQSDSPCNGPGHRGLAIFNLSDFFHVLGSPQRFCVARVTVDLCLVMCRFEECGSTCFSPSKIGVSQFRKLTAEVKDGKATTVGETVLLHGQDTLLSLTGDEGRCVELERIRVWVENGKSDPDPNFREVNLGLYMFALSSRGQRVFRYDDCATTREMKCRRTYLA